MNPVSPVIENVDPSLEIKVAEHQEEYETLPCIPLEDGMVMLSRFELSDEELAQINEKKSVYLYMYTFRQPITPIILSTEIVNIPKASQRKGRRLRIPITDLIRRVNEDYFRGVIADIFDVYDSQINIKWHNYLMLITLTISTGEIKPKVHNWKIDFSDMMEQMCTLKIESIREQFKEEKNNEGSIS